MYQIGSKSFEQYISPEDACFVNEIQNEKLKQAILKLTQKQQTMIELEFWCGLKHWQIANKLGCSRRNVSKTIATALAHIKKSLSK